MSIVKIKELAKKIEEGSLLTVIKSSPAFGYENPYSLVKEMLNLISIYEEPKIDAPPKRKTRRTLKKEESIE
mgnify:CR=1 FL=1